MPRDVFHFKKFSIYQAYEDVMKVSTDSVLLGAFADAHNKTLALDIGCGTGLLSIMLAQKNNNLKIIGIDINSHACECAKFNAQSSIFSHQITILHSSLKNFLDQSKLKFDLIIANPPYYSNSLKSPFKQRNIYRHHTDFSYKELIDAVSILLANSDSSAFYTIIPYYEKKIFTSILLGKQLYIHKELAVISIETKKLPYIFLLEIKKSIPKNFYQSQITIYNKHQQYTQEYLDLTKDFYLFSK